MPEHSLSFDVQEIIVGMQNQRLAKFSNTDWVCATASAATIWSASAAHRRLGLGRASVLDASLRAMTAARDAVLFSLNCVGPSQDPFQFDDDYGSEAGGQLDAIRALLDGGVDPFVEHPDEWVRLCPRICVSGRRQALSARLACVLALGWCS